MRDMGKDAFPKFLWDLLPVRRAQRTPRPSPKPRAPSRRQQQYDQLVVDMKRVHGIRINRWRTSTSGCAWIVKYDNGKTSALIESPYPRGPVSCAVFLHEVGHHAIGFYRYKPRCYEEYMAWQWALSTMRAYGLAITPPVEKRYQRSMRYAVAKAMRRGIKRMPAELVEFVPKQKFEAREAKFESNHKLEVPTRQSLAG